MLQLQRASAGSGKTFTLAKKYIWYLIAIKDKEKGDAWRLRTNPEINDGLKRILAITFTNKATNQMKQRIVQKLADLARADSPRQLTDEEMGKIDYLRDFTRDLGVAPRSVGRAAKTALSVLLNDYSDFKVSTIDSFFQTVLRTFAYESNLNDAYQVEIDNDFIAAAAVNATLNEIDASEYDSIPSFWLHRLMAEETEKGTKNWNVFQKSTSDSSIYTRLLDSVKRLESEDFKSVREKLDEYFEKSDSPDPLRIAYGNAEAQIRRPVERALARAKKAAAELRFLFQKNNLDPAETALRYMAGHLEKIPAYTSETPLSKFFSPINMEGKSSVFKTSGKSKTPVASCPDDAVMLEKARDMYDAYSEFLSLLNSSDWHHWKIYAPQIPYLGLIGVTRRMMKEYLDANNTIQLGETNSMLRRIIGDDDAPFIYERLGARLNHFLIDEFQDTSRLQWENLLPLLTESNGRDEDNLIIGDAKQSIYRFRNADPSLITEAVPEAFPLRIDAGMSRQENTNWRSDRTIVEFNNYFFHALMSRVAEISEETFPHEGENGEFKPTVDFRNLYSNVSQYPSHRDREGFIEVNFLEAPDAAPDSRKRLRKLTSEEKTEYMRREALSRLGPLIDSLLARGYRQSDIAVLVRINSLAKEVIETLVKYNNTPGISRRIEFISEESLLVSSSEAVSIIIGVLEKMAEGYAASDYDREDRQKTRWEDIRCNFNFYAMRHPSLSTAEQVKGFLSEESPADAVSEMLRTMQTVALPALVEAITENFVPEDMRRSQGVFIAALQDIVLEFTESKPADISSFIDWWRSKGMSRSISSPEGTDAVQVMTIHKSKGLEFKCVIIPFDDTSIIPRKKSEWKWVRPSDRFMDMGFPPFVPVATVPALMETIHRDVYYRFFELSTMDMLNAYYVAFTRAVSELYIFTRRPSEKSKESASTLGSTLWEFFSESPDSRFSDKIDETRAGVGNPEAREYMLQPGSAHWNEDSTTFFVGSKREIISNRHDHVSAPSVVSRVIEEYHVDSSPSVLRYVEGDDNEATTQIPDADDPDPRSEGNILHSILSMVKTPADLHRAVLRHKMRGIITGIQAQEWEESLRKAISHPDTAPWFSSGWRVFNERDIIFPGLKNRRPDRILISPDNRKAIIIDYKFGEIPTGKSHVRQVQGYMAGLTEVTGIRDVKGYVWYVARNRIVNVVPPSPEEVLPK